MAIASLGDMRPPDTCKGSDHHVEPLLRAEQSRKFPGARINQIVFLRRLSMLSRPFLGITDMLKSTRPTELDRVFPMVERITAIGAMLGALEQIVRSSELNDDGLFSWALHRNRHESAERFPWKQLGKLLEYPNVVAIPHARLLAAARLVFGSPGPKERAVCLAVLTATGVGMNVRHHYGSDGSDQMSQITFAASLMEKAFPRDSRARDACLSFIAFQTCLSYVSAGTVKLISPVWRNGSAITGIFRTHSYGDATLNALIKRYPALSVTLAWAVILGELSFPLVLIAPRQVAQAMLATSTAFHLANGRFMGLNRFIWAFSGTYPAVAAVSRALRS